MTRSNRKARRTAASNPSSSGASGPSSSSPGAQNSEQGGDSSSSGLDDTWEHIAPTTTLPLLSREMWLMVLDHLVPAPPTTAEECRTRGTEVRRLVLVNKTWAREILHRKTRSALISMRGHRTSGGTSTATWIERTTSLADRYSDGLRSLVVHRANSLALSNFESLVKGFTQLYSLRIEGRRVVDSILTGSTTCRQLLLAGVNEPVFSGAYPALEHLALSRTKAATLPSTFTRERFPSLKTLALDLQRPSAMGTPSDQVARSAPPAVWELSLTSTFNYPFFPALLASKNLEHLHLAVPVARLGPFLSSVEGSLVSLSLTVDPTGYDKDIHTRPDDAEKAWSEALAAPCLKGLRTIKVAGRGGSTSGQRWWITVFATRLKARLAREGVALSIVNVSGTVDPFTWCAKDPVA
ncbi:hypothetical protein JCM10449v2_005794 [Rhodotorula kratochvilovae]